MKIMIKNLPSFIATLVLVNISIVLTVIFAILGIWQGIIGMVVFCVAIITVYLIGYAIPVKYDDRIVCYRKKQINWQDVKITLVPIRSGPGYLYVIAFGNEFMFGTDARKSVKSGFWVMLNYINLKTVAECYHNRFAVVNFDGSSTDSLHMNEKCRRLIDKHNAEWSEKNRDEQ